MVLLAALLALLPLENAEGADADADAQQLRELAASRELDQKIGQGAGGASAGAAEDPHGAVLRLAWGVLLSLHGPESAAERAGQLVGAATEAGALGFLRSGVLDSVPMQASAACVACCRGSDAQRARSLAAMLHRAWA